MIKPIQPVIKLTHLEQPATIERVDIEVETIVVTPQETITTETSVVLPETTEDIPQVIPTIESTQEPSPMSKRILTLDNPNMVTVDFLPIVLIYRSEDYITEGTVDEDKQGYGLNTEDTHVPLLSPIIHHSTSCVGKSLRVKD